MMDGIIYFDDLFYFLEDNDDIETWPEEMDEYPESFSWLEMSYRLYHWDKWDCLDYSEVE